MAAGVVEVIVDNEASRSNVERFAISQGCTVSVRDQGGIFFLTITKSAASSPAVDAPTVEAYSCEVPDNGVIYLIPSHTMGHGDDHLGEVLMRAFVKTIKDLEQQPAKIFFYNTAVRLTATESDLIEPLQSLAAKGVAIYSCGTCLDFFNLKENLLVGQVTNMYDIMDSMHKAAKVISPL